MINDNMTLAPYHVMNRYLLVGKFVLHINIIISYNHVILKIILT